MKPEIEQAEVEIKLAEKLEMEQIETKQTEQPEMEQTEIKLAKEPKAKQAGKKRELQQEAVILEFDEIDDEDEIIDLGDEREEVLAEMKKSLDRLAGNEETEDFIELQTNVTVDFKAKTDELFHEINGMNLVEIEKTVKYHTQESLEKYGIEAEIIDAAVTGSRSRGLESKDSDLDVAVELSTNEREDVLFQVLNENGLHIGEVQVDINPITAQKTGSLETYLPQVENYLEEVREARKIESQGIFNDYKELGGTLYQKQEEMEVTLTVAERGGIDNSGEIDRDISTVDEAVAVWKQVSVEHMNSIPVIGIHIHTLGAEMAEDVQIDILSGNRIHLDVLDDIPVIKSRPQVMGVFIELIAKLPEMEIEGIMSEAMEAAIWRRRMPNLPPAEQLAVEIDRFIYYYDTATYHDSIQNMTEHVAEISESIRQGEVSYLTECLADVTAGETESEERKQAEKLIEKLAEYNLHENTAEIEEQNYYMAAHELDKGAWKKAQKKKTENKQGLFETRVSLKNRLAEKTQLVSGQGKEREEQENVKKNQRGISASMEFK